MTPEPEIAAGDDAGISDDEADWRPRAAASARLAEARGAITAETENLIDTYGVTAEWIRFADAKAAVVLTAVGALASVLIPILGPVVPRAATALGAATLVTFAVYATASAAASWAAFRCIMPYRKGGRHPALDRCAHFHPAAISGAYDDDAHERFERDFHAIGPAGFQREVLTGLLIDSHISSVKYDRVTASIGWLAVSAVSGVLFLLLAQLG